MAKHGRFSGLVLATAAVAAAFAAGAASRPAQASGLCALYSSFSSTSTSVTVSFNVVSSPCTLSLISYQAQSGGNVPVGSTTSTFTSTGTYSLTVPLQCGTNDQVDLFLGPPPPSASTDLQALSITPACSGTAFTQGYWKNHPGAWPVSSLTIGGTSYSQTQLLDVLQSPPAGGNAILILAHQLIAAELNVAGGAPSSCVSSTISSADSLLAGYTLTSFLRASSPAGQTATSLANTLDAYNSGRLCAAGG